MGGEMKKQKEEASLYLQKCNMQTNKEKVIKERLSKEWGIKVTEK